MQFANRAEAGRYLAQKLLHYRHHDNVIVLALPRGGVPVGYEVAEALGAPLDVFIVRKLGLPSHPELAIGAIASGGIHVLNQDVIRSYNISHREIATILELEEMELARREELYRGHRPPLDVADKVVIVVDDGLATGASMQAAVKALRQKNPRKLVAAVPVGSQEACAYLQFEADETICAFEPDYFYAVGIWYQDFSQTSDEEVRELLERARHARATGDNPETIPIGMQFQTQQGENNHDSHR